MRRSPAARIGLIAVGLAICLPLTGFGWAEGSTGQNYGGTGPDGGSGRYVGTEYQLGGASTEINGPQPEVQQAADSIISATSTTLSEIAADRHNLTYGDIAARPGPPELMSYPAPEGVPASTEYRVSLGQGPRHQDSFVYQAQAAKVDTNLEDDTSWTSFSFRGRVTVHVSALHPEGLTGCLVRPASAGIRTVFADGTCSFSLNHPQNVSVEFRPNTVNPIAHPMLVFGNPVEPDHPDPDDPDVLYFGPGVHDVGAGVPLTDGQTVYLAGGAYVRGAFIANGPVHDLTIRGRGVLDGSFMDTGDQTQNKNQPGMIDITDQSSSNVLIEGITLVNGPRFNIRALAHHTTIENVKVMSWWYSTDGMVGGNASLLENNFIKVNDDSIKLFWGDTVARHNTIWQLENGAPFMISWNIHVDSNTFHVYDNDVIHAEHYQIAKSAIFRALHATEGNLSRYLFEDIRVEDAHFRLFDLTLDDNKWHDPALGWGSLTTLIFRDIQAAGPFSHPGLIHGADPDHLVSKVALQDVSIGAVCATSVDEAGIDLDQSDTDAISITRSVHGHSGKGGCRR